MDFYKPARGILSLGRSCLGPSGTLALLHTTEPTGLEPTGSELTGLELTGLEPTGSELTGLEPTG